MDTRKRSTSMSKIKNWMMVMDEVIEDALESKSKNVYEYIKTKLNKQGYPIDKQYIEERLKEG
jgi:hypothetical protein